ncbi:MAG TPA: C40 family peptidase [Burkholderiaceae bacterium]|nr:C40 family peptidase [Burkholderiaceae bacterium]
MPSARFAVRRLLALAALAAACSAQASPDAMGDTMLHLLRERGLVPAAAVVRETQTLVRQVRDSASDLVFSAMNFLGVRYRRGGDTPEEGFDCSGFTRHIFERTVGLVLPHRAEQQAQQAGLAPVARDQLVPGDLVFFNTMRRAFSHVGIYIGEGKFIHAPRTGGEVRVEDMNQAYWTKRFDGARRAELPAAPAAGDESISSKS